MMSVLTGNAITKCIVLVAVMIGWDELFQGPNHPHNITIPS